MTDPDLCEVCKFNKVNHDLLDCDRCTACFWSEMLEDLSDEDLIEIADGPAPATTPTSRWRRSGSSCCGG